LADFVASLGPADEPAYEFGTVVRTSQMGLILTQEPQQAAAEIEKFDILWKEVLDIIAGRLQKHSEWMPSLEFLKSSQAIPANNHNK